MEGVEIESGIRIIHQLSLNPLFLGSRGQGIILRILESLSARNILETKFTPPKAVLLFIKSVGSLKFLSKESFRRNGSLYMGWEEGDKDQIR